MKAIVVRLSLLALLPLAGCGERSTAQAQATDPAVPLYDNLGSYSMPISTAVSQAQQYFDQGLRLYYAFNHAEAIRAFDAAARIDPECAICHWGTALALGPNINAAMDSAAGEAAYAAVQTALSLKLHASPKERALIEALAQRYSAVPAENRAALDSAYARAMGQLAVAYPDDQDIRTLHAEALMDLSPWNYWHRDGSPRPHTRTLLQQFEHVMAANPDHPGANHLYIHAVEEVDPARALPMAERLAGLMPGAGHIVHMPGHIYIRVGRYLDAIRANEHAVHADETYIRDNNPAFGVYTAGYYPHNYDFLAFAASMIGRGAQAVGAADKMASLVPEELLRAPGMTLLQNYITRPLQMRVRFGRWQDIMEAPSPDADLLYARGIWHYARGRALAALGSLVAADVELAALQALAGDPALAEVNLEFNAAPALLSIAVDVLAGNVAAARGQFEAAVTRLASAVEREDALVYGEPPEWSVPVRHDLGAVLLLAGRAAEAEAVFRAELSRFPDNGWSLKGLAASLAAQGKGTAAAEVERRFTEVWSSADLPVQSSRF